MRGGGERALDVASRVRREAMEIAAEFRITKHVEIFRAHHESGSSMRAPIARGWDLGALETRYLAF